MSILNQTEELKVFPCPSCRRTITTAVTSCKYCGAEISDEMRARAVAEQEADSQEADSEWHRNIMLIGFLVMFVGIGLFAISIVNIYAGTGGFFIWSPVIAVFGTGQFIYGLYGMWKAKRR